MGGREGEGECTGNRRIEKERERERERARTSSVGSTSAGGPFMLCSQ